MASYFYTPDRLFVPCLGAATSALPLFSDRRASFKRHSKKNFRTGDREKCVGAKSDLSLGTVVGIVCKGESEKQLKYRTAFRAALNRV